MGVRTAAGAALILFAASAASAQTGRNVLVVANGTSDASQRIAQYYAGKRGVPHDQILQIRAPVAEEIDRATYLNSIETPIASWLAAHAAQDRILYIVLTKDVPLRIAGTAGRDGSVAAVDSELSLLYRKMAGRPAPIAGKVENPFFVATPAPGALRHFSHRIADIYLVTRLDAFTESEATALVDRAMTPAHTGKIVLDEKGTGTDRVGDQWLERTAEAVGALGHGSDVVLERTTAVAKRELGVLGYYSWGSNDPAIRSRRTGMAFVPGAIGAMFVSSDARTFHAPPDDWQLGDWNVRSSYFGGSPQSLTGDLIREGVTGAAGHVAEPYLDATIRPYVLFPAYLSGLNLAEAFYSAMPYLSWQTVVIGDPLCAVAAAPPLAGEDIEPPIDMATELPRFFADRALQGLTASGVARPAAAAFVKGQARLAKGDRAGGRAALKQALQLDPRLTVADEVLAMLDAADHRYDSEVEHYRRILQAKPQNVVALNNLAFTLATRVSKPSDALPFAERAAALAPQDPSVLDTAGWVAHLAGDDRRADGYLARARQSPGAPVDVWIHSAAVHAALGDRATAQRELDTALKGDPAASGRDDVKELKRLLSPPHSSS